VIARVACLTVALVVASPAGAADSLHWNRHDGRVDAAIESWPLPRVLAEITSATGWQVYVEPGTEHRVSAWFEGLPPPEALRRLLGDLNFALLPQVDGPSKLFVYRHSVDAATELVRRAEAQRSKPIENELLVTLKPEAKGRIDPLLKRVDARLVASVDHVGAYRLRFGDAAAARKARAELEHDDDVATLETNLEIAPPAILEPLAMSSAAPPALAPDVSPSSDKVVVGLIDTAVQRDGTFLGDFLQPSIAVLGDHAPPANEITHGTAMAETIFDGVARALDEVGGSRQVPIAILPVDVYGGAETTNTFDVGRGIAEALDRHVNILNLSLGGDNDSPLLHDLIAIATAHGVIVFAAAGNTPGTVPNYPAADPGVIAVTAADAHGNIAPWADSGSFVDAIGPGVNVVQFLDRSWLGTGTSFSTTWVSGWAAGFMASSRQSDAATRERTLMRWGLGSR
jgi:hypothetical protein